MRIEQLYFFQEVARTGSITLAAKHLSISQQGLSNNITTLESEFDLVLFQRGKQGVTLTEDGRRFLEVTERLLNNYNDLLRISYESNAGNRMLRLVTDPYMTAVYFNKLVKLFKHHFPEYQLTFSEESSTLPIIERINSNEADFGFVLCSANLYTALSESYVHHIDNVQIRQLHQYQMYAVVSAQSPLAQLATVAMRDLLEYPLAFSNSHLCRALQQSYPKHPLNIFLQTSNQTTFMQAIRDYQSVGLVCGVSEKSFEKLQNLVLIPVEQSDVRLITIVSKRLQYLPNVRLLLQDLVQFFLE